MPSLKDLRNRIGSVKATRKITKAMQMVAAAKLRRAQEAATAARPYAQRMDRVDLKGVKQVAFANAHGIANRLLALFEAGAFDVATLYFSEFKSVIAQKPTAQQLIPVKLPEATGAGGAAKSEAVYEYEPEENEILSYLLPRNISAQIFRGLLENAASEQGARMSAMDSATRNSGEMIDKLTLRYN